MAVWLRLQEILDDPAERIRREIVARYTRSELAKQLAEFERQAATLIAEGNRVEDLEVVSFWNGTQYVRRRGDAPAEPLDWEI